MDTNRKLSALHIKFSDKYVSFATFVKAVAAEVVHMIKEEENDPRFICQSRAYAIFGRRNVDRWRRKGKITPYKRPGKVEYLTSELRLLQRTDQDYLI